MKNMTLLLPAAGGAPSRGIRSCEFGSGPSAKVLPRARARAAWLSAPLSKPEVSVLVGACSGGNSRVPGRVTTKVPLPSGSEGKRPLPVAAGGEGTGRASGRGKGGEYG